MPTATAADPSYTVFIRLPFPRGDFVDPPAVEWDATKEKALWKVLSKASKNSDIDWNALADKFDVTLPFLLQQSAWLYEQQLSQVRAQMRKVGVSKSNAPSPVPPGAESSGTVGDSNRRNSFMGGQRAPSATSTRKDSPVPGTPSRPTGGHPVRFRLHADETAPPMTRNTSANTITSVGRNAAPTSPRQATVSMNRRPSSPPPRVRTTSANDIPPLSPPAEPASPPPADSSSSESSSDSDEIAQSRLHRRPPRFPSRKMGRSEDADDEDGPAFLPFTASERASHELSSTLRGDPGQLPRRTGSRRSANVTQQSQTSDSSSSSAPVKLTKPVDQARRRNLPSGPLSPRRTLELAGRSPSSKGKGRELSDGTPSMGSSFSDLDDASVTQSALEEALASNMQAGGMASRMSTLSQALKSRYL